jgi:hypothetical protein
VAIARSLRTISSIAVQEVQKYGRFLRFLRLFAAIPDFGNYIRELGSLRYEALFLSRAG